MLEWIQTNWTHTQTAFLCGYFYSLRLKEKNEQKKEMNFPAGGTERVLLWKETFYSNIPVGSTPGFSDTETQNSFKSILS